MTPMRTIDAVVLCGGLGERLRAEIGENPKVMALIGGHPFLNFVIDHLIVEGIKKVVLCTGYKAEVIEDYYSKAAFPLNIEFSRESEPLGTGGALKNARELIKSDPFLVINGDSFCPAALFDFWEFHREKKARASIVLSEVEEIADFGTVTLSEDGRVTGFSEKSGTKGAALVSAGIYLFSQDVFDAMPPEKNFSLEKDLFPALTGSSFYGFVTDDRFIDIGTPERYKQAQHLLKKGKK